jgi:hypothetical protein
MSRKRGNKGKRRKHWRRFPRLAPGHIAYTQAGQVTIRRPDGSVEERPPYNRWEFQYVVRRSRP